MFGSLREAGRLTTVPSERISPTWPSARRRQLEGITQKALTQCLRRLERNGLISRRVIPVSPVAVEYAVTPLGRTLEQPFKALHGWTLSNITEVEKARKAFDLRLEE